MSSRLSRRRACALALTTLLSCTAAGAAAQPIAEPESAADLALALRRLGPTQRVLMVGAHPDDENTAVIAELALGAGADVAYLSLTRGEGGQNLIGPELQEGLGLIRSEELLAARRLDGARQFFTRAYDYGYSKSADEAFRQWPRDSLLADVVAVVRRFRPDVMITVFSGTPSDGHGQHMASGIVARDAFTAAADPARFPGQVAGGLAPHRPAYLYQALWRGSDENAIELQTGDYDPVFGRSHFQVAMASRSRHRSQDMGQPQPPGPQASLLAPVAGDPPAGATSPFAGLDTTLAQRAGTGPAREAIAAYVDAITQAKAAFNPLRASESVQPLARAVTALDRAAAAVGGDASLAFHVAEERRQAARALRLAAGITLDVTADRQRVVPGRAFTLTVRLWNGGDGAITVSNLRPAVPPSWTLGDAGSTAFALDPGELAERTFEIIVAPDAEPTAPYFLESPRDGAVYTWPDDPAVRGLPFEASPVRAGATVRIADAPVDLEAAATFAEVDKSFGELRMPVLVVPAVSVQVSPRVAVVPLESQTAQDDGRAREITVTLTAEDPEADGALALDVPAGWHADPARAEVEFDAAGERRTVRFRVTPPANAPAGEVRLTARFRARDGRTFDEGYEIIAYPHTQPRALYAPATSRIALFPVEVADGLRIGYIEGAGDDGAVALRQMGASVEPVDAAMLAQGDLARFDVLVAGIRAYEVRPDLIENNARVLDWVRRGGTFVVNYNKYELVEGDFPPFPMTMARPHGRVTDELAEVTRLRPGHPLLSWPNDIGPSDFEGWVQERGLYFAETWDDRYTPLLAMSDPGEDPLEGSLLMADVGQGHWIYTGLALFRQWPEAVPGAYRLLANMVSIGHAPR